MPQGHWQTTTFIAGLRPTGVIAPLVLDGPMTRDSVSPEDYRIVGVEALELHHLYRAMAWLGEELPEREQSARTAHAPRCAKDLVEERLFTHRRDLFSRLDLVFMDTAPAVRV